MPFWLLKRYKTDYDEVISVVVRAPDAQTARKTAHDYVINRYSDDLLAGFSDEKVAKEFRNPATSSIDRLTPKGPIEVVHENYLAG